MNDETPRRYRGSLLERAAEQYGYMRPAAPAPERLIVPEEAPLTLTVRAPAAPAPEPETVAEVVPAPQPVSHAEPKPHVAPRTARRQAPIDRIALREGGMLVPGAQITAMAEEFRMVKRQLLLTARAVAAKDSAKAADHARMILVCSAQPDEGKTFCAINLALSMAAEKDMEILLVDADFAKPDILARLGLPEGPGLLDALAGAVSDVEECIIDTDVPQLSVLPAGTRTNGDTELLASDRARKILDGLAKANPRRIVIMDSPPALAASPAAVLAMHAGQVMLVVRADRTSESDLREAVAVLDGCEHIQLLLNSVSFQPGGRRFGNYYGEAGE
ncbi:AAA family ATPase [Sphingomonas psychrotolerans]|uniref:non-specific protein-tyrosine kinase n=1 Tax=Sphingomonas psychrotolerans TaxID=1327635 RepID=A0A2K8MD43_9SPHN|nr:AAA family ATPase [Sphingomonas psychrotolerans]ATY31810.1 exopolysaccharide biosynthesis protein [Sphingomonas psychrotolerans]